MSFSILKRPKGHKQKDILIDFLKYMAFETDPDSTYDPYHFNFDLDPPKLEFMAEIYNTMDPNLRKYKEKGGKLIMYQGWADSIVTPFNTISYYQQVNDIVLKTINYREPEFTSI